MGMTEGGEIWESIVKDRQSCVYFEQDGSLDSLFVSFVLRWELTLPYTIETTLLGLAFKVSWGTGVGSA